MRSRRFGMFFLALGTFAVATLTSLTTAQSAQAQCFEDDPEGGVTGTIMIKACPRLVFEAIQNSRYSDPDRRVVSSEGNTVVLEEKFPGLPIIGRAKCLYREVEVPNQRIDYSIIESSQFRAFNGAWELNPSKDGKMTTLKLTSRCDTFVTVPFKRQIQNAGTRKDIKRRLTAIKNAVEGSAALPKNSADKVTSAGTSNI